jgi:ribA/ribD-fused uncharacterized protein
MELDGERFVTAEHYMMWYKARVFGDDDSVRQIQANDDPAVAKALGRRVRNFKNDVWAQHRFELVVRASLVKFQQNPRLYDYLMSTGDGVLAEASPVDLIWGIGFDAKQPDARNALAWKGQNLLGFALMRARDELSRA